MQLHLGRVLCLLMLVLLAAGSASLAAEAQALPATPPTVGLAVEPGGLLLQDVTPGESYDLAEKTGIFLTIHNRDRNDHTYVIASHRPSEVGNRRVPAGYSDIADPSWLSFKQSEIRVPAQGSSKVRMFLRIPEDERYHNQHWSVSVSVAGKPEPGETLTLAVYPRFEIETAAKPRAELRLRPAGATGLAPSVVTLTPRAEGRFTSEFVISNNDGSKHSYRFRPAAQGETGYGRQISPSGELVWLPADAAVTVRPPRSAVDSGWSIRWWPALWLARHRHIAIPVEVRLPRGVVPPALDWETIVLVERDDGDIGFVRLRVAGAKPAD